MRMLTQIQNVQEKLEQMRDKEKLQVSQSLTVNLTISVSTALKSAERLEKKIN